MPEFIRDFFINKFGLKTLAEQKLGQLVTGVRKHSAAGDDFEQRVASFGALSGVLDPHR
jgi:hypothetical protein